MPSKVVKLWDWLFGKQLNPQELIRHNQRLINKGIRNVDRERYNLERQEQRQIQEIRRMAQKNQPALVRSLANDLVRIRGHLKKLLKMKQNLQGVSIQLQTLETQQSISRAVYNATMVLRNMNKQMNIPRIQAVLKEFEKQNQMMEIKEEMINETMDDVMDHEEDGEESDEIVSQVLDELGIQLTQQLPEAPLDSKTDKGRLKVAAAVEGADQASASNTVDDELMARLENLRKK